MKTRRRAGAQTRSGRSFGVLLRVCASAVCASALACSSAGPEHATQTLQPTDSADQIMFGVRMNLTAQGVRQAYLESDTAFVYENRGHTDLKKVHLTFYSTQGAQTSVLTSDSGTYQNRTGLMEARGNVVVVRADGATLKTSYLRYDQSKNEVSTDQPYTSDTKDSHAAGTGFTSDPTFSNLVTNRLRGAGGSFRLPGQ